MLMKKYIVLFVLILIQSCSSGGGDSNPAAAVKVNLLGVWNYQLQFKNSNCDGLFPKGTATIESLNGDLTKMGNILIQGQGIDTDSLGNCFFTVINELDTGWSGRPAEQTVGEYTAFIVADDLGDNTIVTDVIDSFTATKIQETTTSTNGVVDIFVLTR